MKQSIALLSKVKEKLANKEEKVKLEELLSAEVVKTFTEAHPDIPLESYQSSKLRLLQVVREDTNCRNCPGLARCPNTLLGHYSSLEAAYGYLDVKLEPCDKLRAKEEEHYLSSLIKSHYIAKNVREATFETLDTDADRIEAIEAAVDFCAQFIEKVPSRGLYFYGALGVGKSMIAGAICQDLIRYGIDTYMLYVPEFMREIKRAIQDASVEEKIARVKTATVVIFDDIGAEVVTPWTRDEVLGAILQERTSEGLPTIYTSNLSLAELEEHLAVAQKVGVEKMKAKRIMERIRHFVRPVLVGGKNRRLNN